MPDEERGEEIPRASKTTMPPPPGEPTETPIQREFGKVAPDVPVDVTGPVRRERPPWPVEEPVVREQEALEPGGDPAMRARRSGRHGSDKSEVLGEQFAEDHRPGTRDQGPPGFAPPPHYHTTSRFLHPPPPITP